MVKALLPLPRHSPSLPRKLTENKGTHGQKPSSSLFLSKWVAWPPSSFARYPEGSRAPTCLMAAGFLGPFGGGLAAAKGFSVSDVLTLDLAG